MLKAIKKNPEFKKIYFRFIISFLLLIFILAGTFGYMVYIFNSFLVKRETAIIGDILNKYPEIEDDIISSFSKEKEQKDYEKGTAITGKYGYTKNISPFSESIYHFAFKLGYTLLFILFTGFIFLLWLLSGFFEKLSRRFQNLALGAEKIMEGKFGLHLSENKEGELALVGYQFNQMARRLKLSFENLNCEKTILKDLITDISHQLKTPLASIRTYNDLLLEGAVEKENVRIDFLKTSQQQIEKMEWLVKNLLQLSRLEAGVISLNKKSQNLVVTVEEALNSLTLSFENKEIKLKKTGLDLNLILYHDRQWLLEALINIIKNAIEFSPAGGQIEVEIQKTSDFSKIYIRDQGTGIAKEDISHIFEKFYQGQNRKNQTRGSGIGLALAKLIIEKHEGFIQVDSILNQGTTFIVTFFTKE